MKVKLKFKKKGHFVTHDDEVIKNVKSKERNVTLKGKSLELYYEASSPHFKTYFSFKLIITTLGFQSLISF